MNELTPQEQEALQELISQELKKPPMIGLVGISGVGKSSTINTMFKTNLPISHTRACTTEFREVPLQLQMAQGPAAGQSVQLVVCDAPGLGEDVRKDPEYLDMYRRKLPECDIILWIMSARNRAIALDQSYLQHFQDLQEHIVFGISQVDLVEPMNWKPGFPIPSEEQERNIAGIIEDRSRRLMDILGRQIEIIPYSNQRGYNLEFLFTSLLRSCTGNRSWIFHSLKNFSYIDFIPTEAALRAQVPSAADSQASYKAPHGADYIESPSLFQRIAGLFSPPLPPYLKRVVGDVIGRADIDRQPMSENEIRLVEAWLGQEKRKSLQKP
jgi:predicted GTPase